MRNEHLRPLLDFDADSNRFQKVSQAFAQAKIPDEIVSALRVGQLIVLQKTNSGVRGAVVGDVMRRRVAKTLSQQFTARFENATKPFQHALSTRAGCEFRFDLTQSHDGSPSLDARWGRHPPCLAIPWPPFNTLVGRRGGEGGPRDSAGRGRGTR